MIVKSFNLKNIKNISNFFLLYGDNEGFKDEVIEKHFLYNFRGENLKYDEKQILENKENFFETCINSSLFQTEKLIQVTRVTAKMHEIIEELIDRNISNTKFIFRAGLLEKKSKLRQLFEKEKNLVCIPFYQDNNYSLYKIASDLFKKNNISISSENINLIVDKCSGDRKNLNNEINKILNFCLEKKKINRSEILKLINLYQDENYFELIDNCLAKNHSKVNNIINNNLFGSDESIILLRTFLSRLKRLAELNKLYLEVGNVQDAVNNFKPQIFWKDKEIVEKQLKNWPNEKIHELLEQVNNLELLQKKNSMLSNKLIFDFILNTSNN